MDSPQRFTLRKEYFGGILHDAIELSCELLTPEEYDLLSDLYAGEPFPVGDLEKMSDLLQEKIEVLREKGALVINNNTVSLIDTRRIPPPEKIPKGCLTAPIRVYDTYTLHCACNCKQCCASSSAAFSDLPRRTLAQTERIMRKFYEAGTMEWRFTGGEPTSCDDLLDAIGIAKGLGMAVMLNTNGSWDESMLHKIPNSGVDEIIISLEGGEQVNDTRRSKGMYRQAIRTFDQIALHNQEYPEKKIRVTLNMTIGADNAGEVEYVVRLGAQYGFNVNFVPLRPYGRARTELQGKMLSTEEFMNFSERVQQLREDPQILESGIRIIHKNMDLFSPDYPDRSGEPYPFNYSDCGALATGLGLGPDGRVNACSFLMDEEEYVGPNMLECSVQDAWLHPKMEFFRKAEKIACANCPFYMKQCEGMCRIMVMFNNGRIEDNKLMGTDPYCFRALMQKSMNGSTL